MNSLGDNVWQVHCREALHYFVNKVLHNKIFIYNSHNIYVPETIPCKIYVAALATDSHADVLGGSSLVTRSCSTNHVSGVETRDEPLRTSAWEATLSTDVKHSCEVKRSKNFLLLAFHFDSTI